MEQEKVYPITVLKSMQQASTRFLTQEGELRIGKNIDPTYKIGGISKALGYDRLGPVLGGGVAVRGAGVLNTSDGTERIIAFAGTDAYMYDSGTDSWLTQSLSFTASQDFYTANILEHLIEVNGITDSPQSFDGTTWSTSTNVTDMPKAKYIIALNGRIYLLYVNLPVGGTFPSMVWFSDLADGNSNTSLTWGFESNTDLAQTAGSAIVTSSASVFKTRNIKVGDDFYITTGTNAGHYTVKTIDSETQITLTKTLANTQSNSSFWCGGNYFFIGREDSDVGMGLGINSDRILAFKRFSLYKYQKTSNVATDTLIKVKGAPGTTSQRSVISFGDDTFYFSDTGIWKFNGVSSVLVSTPVQEVIDGISDSSKTNVVAWQERDRIMKMYVGDVSNTETELTINDCVICHDTLTNSWWVEEYPDAIKASIRWLKSNALKSYIFNDAGECFKTETGNSFDGDEINMEIELQPIFPIAPEVSVTFTRFKIYHQKGQDIQIVGYKRFFDSDGNIDKETRRVNVTKRTDGEIEVRPQEEENKAAGFSLVIAHMSDSIRPVIEKVIAYYSGYEIRK